MIEKHGFDASAFWRKSDLEGLKVHASVHANQHGIGERSSVADLL